MISTLQYAKEILATSNILTIAFKIYPVKLLGDLFSKNFSPKSQIRNVNHGKVVACVHEKAPSNER